jgi:hypothetical protein
MGKTIINFTVKYFKPPIWEWFIIFISPIEMVIGGMVYVLLTLIVLFGEFICSWSRYARSKLFMFCWLSMLSICFDLSFDLSGSSRPYGPWGTDRESGHPCWYYVVSIFFACQWRAYILEMYWVDPFLRTMACMKKDISWYIYSEVYLYLIISICVERSERYSILAHR